MLEVADMEDGQLQVNVAIVTDAVCQRLPTHVTVGVLLTCSLERERERAREEGEERPTASLKVHRNMSLSPLSLSLSLPSGGPERRKVQVSWSCPGHTGPC